MKIDAIDFSKEFQQELGNYTGLQDIKMRSLGKRVVIAGANGAGKSRLLNLLDVSRQNRLGLESQQINYEKINKDIKELLQCFKDNPQLEDENEDIFRELEQDLDRKQYEFGKCSEIKKLFEVIKTDNNSVVSIVRYHTKNLEIQSANNHGVDGLIKNTEILKKLGVDGVGNSPSNADSRIDELQQQGLSTAKERSHDGFSNGHKLALASQTYTNAARWLEKNKLIN